MARPDFAKIQTILVDSTRKALQEFAKTEANKEVYAVVFDLMEEYGTVLLTLNTLPALDAWVKKTYAHYTADQINGLSGLKYNAGDFSFIDIGDVRKDIEQWATNFEEYLGTLKSDSARDKNIEHFSDAVASAILTLRDDFLVLDTTDDFIAYHSFHDASDETLERLIRKTVDEATLDKTFPEVRSGRELLEGIAGMDDGQQAKIWTECLESFAFGAPNALATEYFRTRSPLDVKNHLVPLGATAVPHIMGLLDRVIFEPQFSVEGSDEYKSQGSFTRCCGVATDMLYALREIGYADENVELRLIDYIKGLNDQIEDGDSTIGINLMWVAETLHRLIPDKYPMPRRSMGNNRIWNIPSYVKHS